MIQNLIRGDYLKVYVDIKKLFKDLSPKKVFPIILIVFGGLGLFASTLISVEKTHLLKFPNEPLACNLNPVYSCSNVINSDQSTIFGFSNELIGIAMFSVLITTGVVLLAGAKLKPWYWKMFLASMLGFMGFVLWLFYQSVYSIGFLCILCSTAWFSGWTITTAGFAWMYDEKMIKFKNKNLNKILKYKRENIIGFWLVFILILAGLVLNHFWYYYGQYFGQ